MRRIQKELAILGYAPSPKKLKPKKLAQQAEFYKWGRVSQIGDLANPDDVTKWTVLLLGPSAAIAPDCPYFDGAVLKVKIILSPGYPFKCPAFSFVADGDANIPFHPNVQPPSDPAAGQMCGDAIGIGAGGSAWKGTMDMFYVLGKIRDMLGDPDITSALGGPAVTEAYLAAQSGGAAAVAMLTAQVRSECALSFAASAKQQFDAIKVPNLDASIAVAP
jgi:ubiquitin-protein ligase